MKRYLKKDLNLKFLMEANESPEQKINDAVKQAKQNPSGQATMSASDADSNNTNDTPEVKFNANKPGVTQDIQKFANKNSSDPSMKGATITIEESVEFTKKELSNWLRSL